MWRLILFMIVPVMACGGNTSPGLDLQDVVPIETNLEEAAEVHESAMPFDWCDPLVVPDSECFAAKRDPGSSRISLALAIAQKQVDLHSADSLAWNWE